MPLDLQVSALAVSAIGQDWPQFRGPGGLATTDETTLPVRWSSRENIVWRTPLPGPGTSSPVTTGDRIFLTSYTGYALDPAWVAKPVRPKVLALSDGTGLGREAGWRAGDVTPPPAVPPGRSVPASY